MTRPAILASLLLLTACSTTPSDLRAKDPPLVVNLPDNYQEVYRRIVDQARRCMAGNVGGTASFEVDADLFNELGYGEITWSLNGPVRNYYMAAKIEKSGPGSILTVHAGGQTVSPRVRQQVSDWAMGGTGCMLAG